MKSWPVSYLLAGSLVAACQDDTSIVNDSLTTNPGSTLGSTSSIDLSTTVLPTTDATSGLNTVSTTDETEGASAAVATDDTEAMGTTTEPASSTDAMTTGGPATCGDGVVDDDEACDDGNRVETDFCTTKCVLAICGDGIVHDGVEACDDGNNIDDDMCNNQCALPSCGDGIVQPGEACDLGAKNSNTGACTLTCLEPFCGDGFIQPSAGEVCDDKNDSDLDACLGTCKPATCGDGFVFKDVEACDDGDLIDTNACTNVCELAMCGDGLVHAGVEECDTAGVSKTCDVDCTVPVCGDGLINVPAGELCDDGNQFPDDDCNALCQPSLQVSTGNINTCVRMADGKIRCWGSHSSGSLGNGGSMALGDNPGELPVPNIPVGGAAISVSSGSAYACVLFAGGVLRCWGRGNVGRLGYGNIENLGDQPGELPTPDVPVGGAVAQVAVSSRGAYGHTCVILETGALRCWGMGHRGQLGNGQTDILGDEPGELPVPDIALGGKAAHVAAGGDYTCAVLTNGAVKCWGYNARGQLGYGHTNSIGDEPGEMPPPDVDLGGPATRVATGNSHTCALMQTGKVRCWGYYLNGRLGYGNKFNIGDQPGQMPPPDVATGGTALAIATGAANTCVLLATGKVKCWGSDDYGVLGQGKVTGDIGDQPGEMPPPDLMLPLPASQISLTGDHACAVLADNTLRCWGINVYGQLGYGHANSVGDDEGINTYGPVPY